MLRDSPEQGSILLCPSRKLAQKGAILMRTVSTMDPGATPRMVAGPGRTEARPQKERVEVKGMRLEMHPQTGHHGKVWERPKERPKAKGGGRAPPKTASEGDLSLAAPDQDQGSLLLFREPHASPAMTMKAISLSDQMSWAMVRETL